MGHGDSVKNNEVTEWFSDFYKCNLKGIQYCIIANCKISLDGILPRNILFSNTMKWVDFTPENILWFKYNYFSCQLDLGENNWKNGHCPRYQYDTGLKNKKEYDTG